MAYVLDLILVGLFALMVFMGIKRGFIKTIAGVVTFILALVLSAVLAAPTASLVYDAFIEPKVISAFGEEVKGDLTAAQVDEALAEMPAFITDRLGNGEEVLEQADDASESMAQSISDQVIAPTAKKILEPICSLLLFIVLRIIIGLILRALDLLAKIPGLKQLNKALGIVAGVVQGILWMFVAVAVMDVLAAMGLFVTEEMLNSSILVPVLTSINPMGSILQAFVQS